MKKTKRILAIMLVMAIVIGTQSLTVLANGEESAVEETGAITEESNAETEALNVEDANSVNKEADTSVNTEDNGEKTVGKIEEYAADNEVALGTCGDNLTWVLTDDGTLTISGTGEMDDYEFGTSFVWPYKGQIKVLEIGNGVTYLGNYAFLSCNNLMEIKNWGGVTKTGDYVFWWCRNLEKVELPDTMTNTGRGLFMGCSSLVEVKLPNGVISIGDSTFSGCRNLVELKLPDGVTSIGKGAFHSCESLVKLKIPDGVTSIENTAFFGCSSLSEIKIPDGVIRIGDEAFAHCGSLMEIRLPDGVTSIGNRAFVNCKGLTKIKIPDGLINIGDYIFENCSGLVEIKIPDTAVEIGTGEFDGCSNLAKIELPEGLLKIGGGAFSDCIGLTEIEIPDTVTEIGGGIFGGCSNLEKIKLSNGLVRIWDYAFRRCESLKEITIPSSVKHMGALAFDGCSSLETVYFEGNAPIFHREYENDKGEAINCENFRGVTANVYYPIENSTWTEENRGDYGGMLTWIEWDRAAELAIISEATDKEYLIGSGKNAIIKCTGEVKDFVGIEVDGRLLDSSCYLVAEEPTVLTLLSTYLDMLSVGNHTVTLKYIYGSIDAVLTVIEKNENVNNGENIGNTELAIVLDVTDRVYLIGSGDNATIKCTGELKDFVSVFMDGQLVDTSYYSAVEGSTVLTFLSSYLDTLSVGDHVVTLSYTYGSIDTTLTVLARNANASNNDGNVDGAGNVNGVNDANVNNANATPKTGDGTPLLEWLFLMMIGGGCLELVWRRTPIFLK